MLDRAGADTADRPAHANATLVAAGGARDGVYEARSEQMIGLVREEKERIAE